MTSLADSDRALDELGAPPISLDVLLARYGEADHALAHVDDVLAGLGAGLPPVAPRTSIARISVDIPRVGGEGDALPAALGEEIEVEVSRSEPLPVIAADPLAAPRWASSHAPDPKVRARFDALFQEPAVEAAPVETRESQRPREELDRLLDQEIDPSEFPRASESVSRSVDDVDPDSSMEMLVDDDDILEIDDDALEEIE